MDIKKKFCLPSLSYKVVVWNNCNDGIWGWVKWSDGLEQWKSDAEIKADIAYTENLNKETV